MLSLTRICGCMLLHYLLPHCRLDLLDFSLPYDLCVSWIKMYWHIHISDFVLHDLPWWDNLIFLYFSILFLEVVKLLLV